MIQTTHTYAGFHFDLTLDAAGQAVAATHMVGGSHLTDAAVADYNALPQEEKNRLHALPEAKWAAFDDACKASELEETEEEDEDDDQED